MPSPARTRLNKLKELQQYRDNDLYARGWLGNDFHKLLAAAYIDGKNSVTFEKNDIRNFFSEVTGHLCALGYTVTESQEPSFHGEVDYVTISWTDTTSETK